MSRFRTIKELVIKTCMEEGRFPSYDRLTKLVRQEFPTSKWQATHYAWYKSKIKTGKMVIPGISGEVPSHVAARVQGIEPGLGNMSCKVPPVECLDRFALTLAQMVAQTSWLPHPDTVRAVDHAVFPTARARKDRLRFATIKNDGSVVGMYDDNATPQWTLFWSHGITGTRPSGWTIAHVWPVTDDIASFTHLANLAMVPEPFGSLTDKTGPLTAYLRWHAWQIYGWKPETAAKPQKPKGYDGITWRYLMKLNDPIQFLCGRLATLDNERVRILRPIMQERGML